jgi:Xaa-Pro aminopeptidase
MNRLPALQAAMRGHGVDVCVLAASDNLRYLLGYDGMAVERLTALVVTADAAAMIIPDFDAAEYKAVAGRPPVVVWADRDGPDAAVEAAFAKVGSPTGRALVDEELPFAFYAGLRDRLEPKPGLAGALFAGLRLRKSAEELERIARTGELVSLGVDLACEVAEPGMTELELKQRIEARMWDGGAESVDYVLVQAGPNSASAHHDADRTPLRAGEPVLVDVAVRLDGYYADITGQVFLGDPPAEYLEHYDVVRRAQHAGVAAATVGATAHDVASAASAVIVDAGLAEFNGPRTGHGLGASVHEWPSVVEGSHHELPAGAVITVEPGVYLPGRYGIRIEDTVAVTDAGPRQLTRGARPLASRTRGVTQ